MTPSNELPSDFDFVQNAVNSADLRVLLMSLYHMTGEERWLEPPFRPIRDTRLVADPSAGFSLEIQQEIREATTALLLGGPHAPAVVDPGPDRFQAMISNFLGEQVPVEYVQMVREDMGFANGDAVWSDPDAERQVELDVVIVGTGIFGLALAAKLNLLGINYTMIERNGDVGGTWANNRYPGCGVDTPNHFYSYSYAPNPAWRHYFSPRSEIQEYIERFSDDFGIRDKVRFETELVSARWDEGNLRWMLTTVGPDGVRQTMTSSVLVSATGHFDDPAEIKFDGMEDFAGEIFHTARWPDDADLNGKRVGVIGTGASAVQLVPTIADRVKHLAIFQRTAQWVRPVAEYDLAVAPSTHWLFENVPYYDRWYRFGLFWRYGDGLLRFLKKDPDWPHPERSLNKTNDRHRRELTDFIRTELASKPELIDDCVPSYPPFGKRILINNRWFATLCLPNVDLVTEPIRAFDSAGVTTVDEERHELDVVVLATGFNVTNLAARVDIEGRGGIKLADDWANDDPTAYLGITVPGFPNFFVMYGPNTNSGHGGSGMWMAETQSRYITSCLVAMVEAGVSAVDCREECRTRYTEVIDGMHEELVWTHTGVDTYYRTNAGKVRSPMPFRLVDYWYRTHAADLDDFHRSYASSSEAGSTA
jgi:4-hydroxyacetophenone monooxygenase